MKNITGYIEATGICKAKVVEITKQDAADILQLNTANRKISRSNVDYLRQSMNDGRWMFNGDTIVLDAQGKLKSGQHRLTAFVGSELESMVVLLVTLLCDDDVLLSLNRGMKLTSTQYLNVKGFKNARDLAGIGRILLGIELTVSGHIELSQALKSKRQDYEIENIIKHIPTELADQVNKGHHTHNRMSPAVMGAMIFAAKRYPEVMGDIRKAWSMAREGDTPKLSLAWGIARANQISGNSSDSAAEKVEKTLSVIRSWATSLYVPDRIFALKSKDFINQIDMAQTARQGIFAASSGKAAAV